MNELTDFIVPVVILGVITIGILAHTDIFEAFTEGAAEGIKTTIDILPALIILSSSASGF